MDSNKCLIDRKLKYNVERAYQNLILNVFPQYNDNP